jgi:hypothetical protein
MSGAKLLLFLYDFTVRAEKILPSQDIKFPHFQLLCLTGKSNLEMYANTEGKSLQFLPYGRSIGSWICLTHKTNTCHTVQNTIRYDIR